MFLVPANQLLEIALMSLKPGKAAGLDGIYPERMDHIIYE
jgi:hypothetical protein